MSIESNDGLRFGVETIVFEYDTPDQREQLFALIKPLWAKDDGLRVTAISRDNEIQRVELLTEASEKYDDHWDMREVQQQIFGCPDLSKWAWDDPETSQ
jgi:hypothetical protein